MNDQQYQSLLDRLSVFVDSLDITPMPYDVMSRLITDTIIQSTMNLQLMERADRTTQEPPPPPVYHVKNFSGLLQVPEIEEQVNIPVPSEEPRDDWSLPGLRIPLVFPRYKPLRQLPRLPQLRLPIMPPKLDIERQVEPVQVKKPQPVPISVPLPVPVYKPDRITDKPLDQLINLRDKLVEKLDGYRQDPWLGHTLATIAAKYGDLARPQVFARFANLLKSGTLMKAFQVVREVLRTSPSRGRVKLLAIPVALFTGGASIFADEPTEQQIQLLARYSQTLLEKENVEREIMLRQLEQTSDMSTDTQPLSGDTWEQMKQVYFELVPVEITPEIEELFPDPRPLSDMGTNREDVFPNEAVYKVTPTSQLLQLIQSAEQGDEEAVARIDQMQQKIKSVKVKFGDPSTLDMDQAIRDGYVQQYKFPNRTIEYHGPVKGRNTFLRYKKPEQQDAKQAFEQQSTPYDFDDYQGTRPVPLVLPQFPEPQQQPTYMLYQDAMEPVTPPDKTKADQHRELNNILNRYITNKQRSMQERDTIVEQLIDK